MDVAFPYKEAITNAYDLIIVTRSNIAWKLYGLIDHTTTHVASRVSSYVLEEKAKGQSSILYGKASFLRQFISTHPLIQ